MNQAKDAERVLERGSALITLAPERRGEGRWDGLAVRLGAISGSQGLSRDHIRLCEAFQVTRHLAFFAPVSPSVLHFLVSSRRTHHLEI